MTKIETIVDLIARALGVAETDVPTLTAYLDLYAEAANVTTPAQPAVKKSADHHSHIDVDPSPEPEPVADKAPCSPFSGNGGAEKRQIYERLAEYRTKNGLGCFSALASASNGALTESDIGTMFNAIPTPLAKWKILNAALDFVEAKQSKKGAEA